MNILCQYIVTSMCQNGDMTLNTRKHFAHRIQRNLNWANYFISVRKCLDGTENIRKGVYPFIIFAHCTVQMGGATQKNAIKRNTNLRFCGTNLCLIALKLCIFAAISWYLCKNFRSTKKKRNTNLGFHGTNLCNLRFFVLVPQIIFSCVFW